jgi:hypothetical protein
MKDVEIHVSDRPGALAELANALGAAGISIEGGGIWVVDGTAVAHYLFADDAPVASTLRAHGIAVVAERPTVLLRLDQGTPGQLGAICGLMADAGVNISTQYSDHDHQLVLVVDNEAAARTVAHAWMSRRA